MSIGIGSVSGGSAAAAAQVSSASESVNFQMSVSVLKQANALEGQMACELIASATGVGTRFDTRG